ncbi:MAG: DUF983 domain-containing protein [Cognatishimia sp.]
MCEQMECAMTEVISNRPLAPALKNGLALKCPKCGEGNVLHSYLKVHDECSVCHEELHHHRADDGPAYLTILLVGKVMIFSLTMMWEFWRPDPLTMALVISAIAIVVSLLALPRFKALIVAYQWAKRMHGFDKR